VWPNLATITVVATGNTAPLEFSIDGGVTFQTSPIFTSVAAGGNVAIQVRNGGAGGCVITTNVAVALCPAVVCPLVATATVTACVANLATITVVATGNTAPLEFSINGGVTFQTSPIFTNVAAGGNVAIQVRNGGAGGCVITTNVAVALCPAVVTCPTITAAATLGTGYQLCRWNNNSYR
jgi:hypothetical protein